MAANDQLELYKQHHAGEDKYTYFLLAAAAAAIGFAVQKTEGLRLSWWLLPVAAATVCWAVSFFFGCKRITWVQVAIFANANFLKLRSGIHPDQPDHPAHLQVALEGVRSALDKNMSRVQFYAKWQFRTLVLGAILFILWRILEMYRITYAA